MSISYRRTPKDHQSTENEYFRPCRIWSRQSVRAEGALEYKPQPDLLSLPVAAQTSPVTPAL